MNNLEQLKEQFFINAAPLWKLYRGTRKAAGDMISSNLSEFRMSESWDKLEKVINLNKGSIFNFTVYQTDKEKNTTGGYTLFLDIKEGEQQPQYIAAAQPPALSESKLFEITQSFNNTIQELKQEIKEQQHEREKQELKNEFNLKIQELENTQTGKRESLEMFKLFALNLLKPKQAAAIGAAEMESPGQHQEQEQEGNQHEEGEYLEIDFNSVIESTTIIKNHIPNAEELLNKLAETLENASQQERENLINILKMYLNVR